jgi:hypothetical protein
MGTGHQARARISRLIDPAPRRIGVATTRPSECLSAGGLRALERGEQGNGEQLEGHRGGQAAGPGDDRGRVIAAPGAGTRDDQHDVGGEGGTPDLGAPVGVEPDPLALHHRVRARRHRIAGIDPGERGGGQLPRRRYRPGRP